jgi:hypothetical protein
LGLGYGSQQDWIGIDSVALPPFLVRPELKDREVQLRCVRLRIAGGADVSDHIAACDWHPLADFICVMIQVGIVEAVVALTIELVDSQSSLPANKELADDAVSHRANRRAARPHDVDRFMTMPMMNFVEGIMELRRLK